MSALRVEDVARTVTLWDWAGRPVEMPAIPCPRCGSQRRDAHVNEFGEEIPCSPCIAEVETCAGA